MTADDLRNWMTARPFEPFRLNLSDGRHFDVRGPELALVSNTTTAVVVPDVPDGRSNMVVVNNAQVTTATPLHLADPRG